MIRHGNSIFNIGGSIPCLFDLDASKVIEAVRSTGVTITPAMRHYAHYLISNMKNIGTWQLSNAVYGFVGGTANSHKWNWKDLRDVDAAFRLVYSGTFTHSDTGSLPTSSSSVANSFFNPSLNLSINSAHISFYSGTNIQNNFYDISAGAGFRMYGRGSGFIGGNLSSNTFHQIATGDSLGWYGINRINSSQSSVFKNGVLNTITNTSSFLPNALTRIFGENTVSSLRQGRLVTIGSGLTETQLFQQSQIATNAQAILNRL